MAIRDDFAPGEILAAGDLNDTFASKANKANGYQYSQSVYFTSNDSFTKADYSWLRAIRVRVQGGGGAGGGAGTTSATQNSHGAGGGSGTYAETFITDISALPGTVTVTVGSGGVAGTADVGGNGSASSFENILECPGGEGGTYRSPVTTATTTAAGGAGGTAAFGSASIDYEVRGVEGGASFGINPSLAVGGTGGASFLGTSSVARARVSTSSITSASQGYGSGGGGAMAVINNSTVRAGRNGQQGIVIVDLFS